MTTSTTPHATTYDQLLDRVIADGIAEVREAYADPKDHHKRDGAIDGFEACRGKTPDQLVELWQEAGRRADRRMDATVPIETYLHHRYFQLQVEWCLNVLSVGLSRPLLAHLPTYRGAMKYADVVGVRREGAEA